MSTITPRESASALLRDLADWIESHPHAPMPTDVRLSPYEFLASELAFHGASSPVEVAGIFTDLGIDMELNAGRTTKTLVCYSGVWGGTEVSVFKRIADEKIGSSE